MYHALYIDYDREGTFGLHFGDYDKATVKQEIEGTLIESQFKFKPKTIKTIETTSSEVNYDLNNKTYKDVKNDVISQLNPNVNTKNQVDPTGPFYPIIKDISQNEYGVDPRSVMAKKQNLTKPESTSARTKIAKDMQSLGPRGFIKSILGPFAQTVQGEAIGISPSLLKGFYKKGGRVPNIYGHVLNVDNMSNGEIMNIFGINPDFTLVPHQRKFDGPIKGAIVQASTLAANQGARIQAIESIKSKFPKISTEQAVNMLEGSVDGKTSPFVNVSMGKPDVMFSLTGLSEQNKLIFQENFGDVITDLNRSTVDMTDWKSVRDYLKTKLKDHLKTNQNPNGFTNENLRGVAKDFVKWNDSYEKIQIKKAKLGDIQLSLETETELGLSFEDHMIRNVEDAFLDKNLFNLLGSLIPSEYKTSKDIFNDKIRIEKARAAVPGLINHMITSKEDGGLGMKHGEAVRFVIKYGGGMYSTSSRIHDKRFTIRRNNKTGFNEVILNPKHPNGKGNPRSQVFESVGDFINIITSVDALGIKGMSKNDIIEKYEIDVSNLSETSKGALNDIKRKGENVVFKERLQQANEARKFVEIITDYYISRIKAKNPTMDYADLLMLGKMFGSHMQSPMRRSANLAFIGLGVDKVRPDKMGSEL